VIHAILKAICDDLTIGAADEYIDPADRGEADEMQLCGIADGIFSAHT
jgi:hypothetical protein